MKASRTLPNFQRSIWKSLGRKFRWQKIAFETASGIFDQMKPSWKGNKEYLLAQLIRLMEEFVASGKIEITPPLFNQDDVRRRLVVTLNLSKVVQHMWESIILRIPSRWFLFSTRRDRSYRPAT